MAASVQHLLASLEAHLERTTSELKTLRQENAWLKQQLAAQSEPNDDIPVPEASLEAPESIPQQNEKTEPEAGERGATEGTVERAVIKEAVQVVAKGAEAPSPQALLNQWYQRYPKAFFKGHTKPLKIGIHHDLAQREPWSGKLIRRALANYVNLPRYVKSMREGVERFDLDGNPVGKVDKEASLHARQRRKERPSDESAIDSQKNAAKPKNATTMVASAADSRTTSQPLNKHGLNKHVSNKHGDKNTGLLPSQGSKPKPISLEEKLKGLQQKFEGH
ncbi:MAG: ProQ/FINO family protein [Halomonas sp.]|nr:ProQ/FINO family protein [Halomonas sp.]MDP3535398.1 ProQ/FINO family protein [Halomonas sp.]